MKCYEFIFELPCNNANEAIQTTQDLLELLESNNYNVQSNVTIPVEQED